jgi:hypothetical protein
MHTMSLIFGRRALPFPRGFGCALPRAGNHYDRYASNVKRVIKEDSEPRIGNRVALHVLQLLPDLFEFARDSDNESGYKRSRLELGRSDWFAWL